MITKEKCFDLLSNSLYWFFKEMYGISLENLNVDIGLEGLWTQCDGKATDPKSD